MTEYAGRCRGGPLDGRDFVSATKTFLVEERFDNIYPQVLQPTEPFETKTHEYRFVAGQFIWQRRDQ